MVIGIVDDEIVWIEKIKQHITGYFKENEINNFTITTFCDKASILSSYKDIDLLFLDIELSDSENGFQIAEEISKNDTECKICFLTSHVELSREGYKFNAFRYIDKLHLEEINEALSAYFDSFPKTINIECKTENGIPNTVNSADIVYIETYGRKLRFHTQDNTIFYSSENIKGIAEKMEEYDFFQIQRSYIVNLQYVLSYDSRIIRLTNNTVLPISRDKVQQFKKRYFEWRRKRLG